MGSVKTNLGHSEGVSGISSVIKVTLALEQGLIPATIGVDNVNPDLKLADRNVTIVTKPTAWPEDIRQRASINSFGYGGANAHVIIESVKSYKLPGSKDPTKDSTRSRTAQCTVLLPFSASNKTSLVSRVSDLASPGLDHINTDDLAYTLESRRSKLSTRGFIVARRGHMNIDVAPANLRILDTESDAGPLPVAFIFTGQGAQWPQMGLQLMEQYPSFRDTIDALDAYLTRLPHKLSWSISGERGRYKIYG
jgi:acyl transferase domain-containing protein